MVYETFYAPIAIANGMVNLQKQVVYICKGLNIHESTVKIPNEFTEGTSWKEMQDASEIFSKIKHIIGKVLQKLPPEDLKSHTTAFEQEFASVDAKAIHIKGIWVDGQIRNNKMKCINGDVRGRKKTFRGLDRDETAQILVDGIRIDYNCMRLFMGLDGKSRTRIAGLELPLEGIGRMPLNERAVDRCLVLDNSNSRGEESAT